MRSASLRRLAEVPIIWNEPEPELSAGLRHANDIACRILGRLRYADLISPGMRSVVLLVHVDSDRVGVDVTHREPGGVFRGRGWVSRMLLVDELIARFHEAGEAAMVTGLERGRGAPGDGPMILAICGKESVISRMQPFDLAHPAGDA